MVNGAKTPTGKAKKGQVVVRIDSSSVKACFPRSYFADGKQIKLGTGINPDDWEATAAKLQRRLQLELEDGKLSTNEGIFNLGRYQEILEEYGLRAKLRLVRDVSATSSSDEIPPKPQLSLLEVWDMYCEYRKPGLRESTYKNLYQTLYRNFIKLAIEATKSEDALKIRNWLIENRNTKSTKQILINLSKAYQLGIKNKLLTHNPYDGLADEITTKGAKGKKQNEVSSDNDVLDQSKAYTWDEVQAILDLVKYEYTHYYNFIKFKFLTGCRTGEAVAFMWCDIEWDKERILIRRTYEPRTRKFYPLKNDSSYKGELIRRFPIIRDGELWKLLQSIPEGQDNDVVFTTKNGKIINDANFGHIWRGTHNQQGIIPQLIEQGKLSKYLSPYNTRHTFITHQVFDLGQDEKIVAKWCGHNIDVSNKHYQDVAIFAEKTNPDLPANQQSIQQTELDILKEQLRQQQELINKLLAEKETK
ncbi:Phage integrase [Trichormus variabilis ATCC 29413]|uniref:Phage integrase n=2 Tax=Anabaena variabilis TaxID=264691 RepID=Q3M2Y3_TRIV2|nr:MULTISPECIES: tyrosine-type recombinase/integrase [Nostocaceae]ABA24653.1 Phage integrase [Trichormus variabilis ATCC 29413]MBC1216479.1 tyrosine-type recombinase/integrase [Trichormus variabilis ARAD]MBC1258626.1 tyrosine-type recombinase/integrase [Trichormus variabilis V5]MBC1270123.1 tyrosine-type recombinase/integrase [Trichormus variabilis FSR]MBC1303536.1 tyrosine-type recombinase/integrase [Trichormus variabilis N2B]